MKLDKSSPMLPTAYGPDHVAAFQALERGDADARQQKMILQYVIVELCDTYGMSYRPGEDGRRDTDFAEGKRHIGNQIVKMVKLSLTMMKENKK